MRRCEQRDSRCRVEEFIASLPSGQSQCVPCVADLTSLSEVRSLAASLSEAPPDLIVLCAGVATLPVRTLTEDGYESQFAVNHLAHFALIEGMRPSFRDKTRVVVVSSDVHRTGGTALDVDNLQGDHGAYHWFSSYIASKYCNVLFARELATRGLEAVSCSPGTTDTPIDRNLSPLMRFAFRYCGPGLMAQTVGEGASCVAHCMVSEDLLPGAFYVDCQQQLVQGPEVQGKLWDESERLVRAAASRPAGGGAAAAVAAAGDGGPEGARAALLPKAGGRP